MPITHSALSDFYCNPHAGASICKDAGVKCARIVSQFDLAGILPVSNHGQDGHATALLAAPPHGGTIFLDSGARIG